MPAVGIIRRQGFRMMFTAGCGKRIARFPFSSVRQLPVRTALRQNANARLPTLFFNIIY